MKHWRQIFQKETYRREVIKYDIDLFSPMDPISLAAKLKAEMELSKKRTGRQVYGFGSEKKMNLFYAKRKGTRNFAAQLAANMSAHEGGTRITGNVRQILKDIPFVFIWCAFTGIFFLGFSLIWFAENAPLLAKLIASGIPGLMFISVLLLEWGRAEPKPPKDIGSPQDILDWLADIVDARDITNTEA